MLNGVGMNLIKKIIFYISILCFVAIISTVFALNFEESNYIHNGYYSTYSPTDLKYFLYSLIFTSVFIFLFKYLKLNKKLIFIFLLIFNILIFILRLIIINSFFVVPAGDSIQLFLSVLNFIVRNNPYDFMEGGYVTTYSYQLMYSITMMPLVSMFKETFSAYFIVNAILIQTSLLLLAFSFSRNNQLKLFWINIGLNLFIPNIFYQFILYSDPFGLFFISLSIFVLSKSKLKNVTLLLLLLMLISIAMGVRTYAIVISIGILIVFILYSKLELLKSIIFIISLSFLMFFNQTIIENVFNLFYHTEVGQYSMPSSYSIALGLQGGFNPKYINYFAYNGHNEIETNIIIWDDIYQSIDNMNSYDKIKSHIVNSLRYSWTNPDFDAMSYIMPQVWNASLSEFLDDNSIRLGRASSDTRPVNNFGEIIYEYLFSIRNIEKIFIFTILELSLISLIYFKKYLDDWRALFLLLTIVGFSLLFMIVEKQPRYLYVAVNLLIVFAFYILPESLQKSNDSLLNIK